MLLAGPGAANCTFSTTGEGSSPSWRMYGKYGATNPTRTAPHWRKYPRTPHHPSSPGIGVCKPYDGKPASSKRRSLIYRQVEFTKGVTDRPELERRGATDRFVVMADVRGEGLTGRRSTIAPAGSSRRYSAAKCQSCGSRR